MSKLNFSDPTLPLKVRGLGCRVERFRADVASLSETIRSMPKAKAKAGNLLILTPDRLGHIRIGLGMRHWEIAKALSLKGLGVTLACANPLPEGLAGEGFPLVGGIEAAEVMRLAWGHHCVMVQGDILCRYPELRASSIPIISDMVTPIHIESIETSQQAFELSLGWIQAGLARGDFCICGNERQRMYWLGMLTALGRLNKDYRDADHELRTLIDVVGFGIDETPPLRRKRALKGVIKGIGKDDFLLLWFGGIWDWLEPLTLIRAVHQAWQVNPRIKLYFSNYRHPNGIIPQMAQRALQLSQDLDALGRCVFMSEYPSPFGERADYLLDADMGVICQAANFETQLAARTRALDYIWANLPILINAGDEISELVARENIGMVVPALKESEWVEALINVASQSDQLIACSQRLLRIKPRFYWSSQVEPIVRFISSLQKN